MAATEMSSNYSGRVLQRNAFRSLVGRRRAPGTAIGSILTGIRTLPPRPEPMPAALVDDAVPAAPEQA